jgi:hypothetical protein
MKKQRKKVTKKTPSNGKPKRVQCKADGCRRYRIPGADFCNAHSGEDSSDPLESVVKLSELESLRFAALDTEIRNYMQGIQIEELNINKEAVEYQNRRKQREHAKERLLAEVKAKKAQYKEMVTALAGKFNMDPKHCAIDPETGIIRDLRGESTS